ncbi:hypothetical protein [Cytobacillus purgationiresistens]|uniref:Fe-S cluster assembly iron-binding protein IscA n=1 Tax=Cytobacillus purgationiresistens TaxID=863449 RepID=A0ABU0ADT6_9BACI|nr:hypothetical protein [Cytobacillus purgationiresistens]MDQ0268608.1 Fe-S cluster assembly iron-binding protein IscA [Cytobacillus purgationiresistens]
MKLSLEEQPLGADHVFEVEEISFLIHEEEMVYFNQTKIDFDTDLLGRSNFKLIRV